MGGGLFRSGAASLGFQQSMVCACPGVPPLSLPGEVPSQGHTSGGCVDEAFVESCMTTPG